MQDPQGLAFVPSRRPYNRLITAPTARHADCVISHIFNVAVFLLLGSEISPDFYSINFYVEEKQIISKPTQVISSISAISSLTHEKELLQRQLMIA